MAKQPVTRDRFRIFAETNSESMGPLLAALTKMGLENIGYELITDVRTFGKNERKVHETTGVEFAKAWVADHATFRAVELVAAFGEADRTPGSAYTALRELINDGTLRKTSPGNYQRADVKAIAPPAEGEAKARTRPPSGPKNAVPNKDVILKAIRGRKKVSVKAMSDLLTANGRTGHSASPIISGLARSGILKQIEPGLYEVVAKKEKKSAAKAAKPKTKTSEQKREADRLRAQAKRDRAKAEKLAVNGPGTPTQQEQTNG